MDANPLLDFSGLTRFPDITPGHVGPAVDTLLADCRATIARASAEATPATWDEVVQPLTDANERLSRAWGAVEHLKEVVNSPELRAAYDASLPKVAEYQVEAGQNVALCAKYKAIAASPAFAGFPAARRKVVENALREFRLSGVDLPEGDKARFMEIEKRLSDLANNFAQNELEATDDFALFVEDQAELEGVPGDILEMFAEDAKKAGKSGWKITLQMPSYWPVLQYCANRELREGLYRAMCTLASEFGPAKWDNTPIITERLRLCREEARILGFDTYAHLSVERKMADTPRQVVDFIRDLASRSKPFAERDKAALEAYAREHYGIAKLEPWDRGFIGEKLRLEKYDFSDNEVKQYFPEHKVVAGLFGLVKTLYDIDIERAEAPVWHPDAKYYRVLSKGKEIAGFYFDLYARENKQSGAWAGDARGRRLRDGAVQTPVSYLTCNFTKPIGGKPALFTHDEVTTLFHEFGHGLQHMLTRVDDLGVSGMNGVEWDAVELPSQIMENFCWEWDSVRSMSSHVDTGAPLPRELFDKMVAAKNFCSGINMVRQLEFSLFDMLVYGDFDAGSGDWQKLYRDVIAEIAVIPPPEYNRFLNTFGHIFAGGYSAGYYSYKWAEVLSADAYSAFEEAGGANPATGKRFLDEVLAVGGSRPSAESFRAFRGREPRIDALLRHNGLVATA